jgi:hypothetical protein
VNSLETAYLAGFVDGEGSIQIGRGHWQHSRRGYTLHVSAKQVDPTPLRMLSARFGGRVIRVIPNQPNRLIHFRWGIVGRKALAALEVLSPYLRVKRSQADLGIAFQRSIFHRGGLRVSEWEYAERDAYAEALSDAKRIEYD